MAAQTKKNTAEKEEADITVEEAFAQLQELLRSMEAEGTTLEESFADYEKGMKLIRLCNEKIDRVEKKVQQMSADGTLKDFDHDDGE